MKRIKLGFANIQVDFIDRELALKLIEDWADKGTFPVQVVYGPEGCGKSAWLKQSIELLKELGFNVIYVNPLNKEVLAEFNIIDLRDRFLNLIGEALAQNTLGRLAWLAFDTAKELIKVTKGKIAIIIDDAFQVIGVRESALYVKALLNLIEYPPSEYERIVTIVATSEGLSRWEIGRHNWADLAPIWNMSREGFKQLYDQIPGNKPTFEEAWKLTGGNPRMLEDLYEANWRINMVIERLVSRKGLNSLIMSLSSIEKAWLWEAIEDPDSLFTRERMNLVNKLVELNLVINDIPDRKTYLWVDEPPPERDAELGIGRYIAWQSPIHKEAVRRALEEAKP